MKFEKWEPVYIEILNSFGWKRSDDELSAIALHKEIINSGIAQYTRDELRNRIKNKNVIVIGNGPSLSHDIKKWIESHGPVVIAADSVMDRLIELEIIPDFITTDLDGNLDSIMEAVNNGSIPVIHSHGDNRDIIKSYMRNFSPFRIVATTQSYAFERIYNFGGFTDGDRALFMADELSATPIYAYNFDFNTPYGKNKNVEIKRKKLEWAKNLINRYLPYIKFLVI
ncbi:MAG: DUF115 domain-containing protein [Candidatus Thermoplasmatota archaeon]|jgi:uncharacterized Rossmann fold enzyme|nr:DUF115 domain-containing protein [Candidatus Thermoplasmatota archaeon]MCL5963735.1 DUF115 domain-containing protein [Candidatus Thermoplasmatota archaeon]